MLHVSRWNGQPFIPDVQGKQLYPASATQIRSKLLRSTRWKEQGTRSLRVTVSPKSAREYGAKRNGLSSHGPPQQHRGSSRKATYSRIPTRVEDPIASWRAGAC